jgi:hypothetical protein
VVADPDPGSGCRFFDSRDPGDGEKKSGSGSGVNNPDHISESLETSYGLKYIISLMWIRDPGWKKFGSGITSRIRNTGLRIRNH